MMEEENPPKSDDDSVVMIEEIVEDHLPGGLEYSDPGLSESKEPFFLQKFVRTPGCLSFLCVTFLIATSIAMTVGMVPEIMSDRYARLNHGYVGVACELLPYDEKTEECRLGGDSAQNVAAWSNTGHSLTLFFFGPVVGSMSDERGRRRFLLIGIVLLVVPQLVLVMLQWRKSMSPLWYYISHCSTGLVNWLPIVFAAISDIMPGELRAPSFALVLGSFSLGFSVAPYLSTVLPHIWVSAISLACAMTTFLYAFSFVPETLSYQTSETAHEVVRRRGDDDVQHNAIVQALSRPFRDLSILNRNTFFHLVSVVTFLTGFTCSTDQTLILYYLENHLNFEDSDTALFMFINGMFSILVNFFLVKQFIGCFGEKHVLIVAILFGTVHNFLYGIAHGKLLVFVAVSLSALTGMSYPIIASMQSYNCADYEQGRMQGAFFSLSALANAAGPSLMTTVYGCTKHGELFGPGTMFLVVSCFNAFAVSFAVALQSKDANSKEKRTVGATGLNQLLLEDDGSLNDDSASVHSRVEFF